MNLEEIQKDLIEGQNSPHTLAEYRIILSGEYSFVVGQLEEILKVKPAKWNELRREQKSDKATERIWEATIDGLNETGLRWRLKKIEKMMGAIGSLLRVAENEAKNNF